MIENIIVIATPRAGGTVYSKNLSSELGLSFVNEPYASRAKDLTRFEPISGRFGDIVPNEKCVIHTIVGQFLSKYHLDKFPEAEYIFLERRDKWAQLLSYCIMRTTAHEHGVHNLNFNEPITISVSDDYVQSMFHEWIMYENMVSMFPHAKQVYYEDIEFTSQSFYQKSRGYENVTILNLDDIKRKFMDFWKIEDPAKAETIIDCNGISVVYSKETDGGGTKFKDDYVSTIEKLYPGRVFERCYEWCAGPGFIGFSILGAGLTESLVLSEFFNPAIEQSLRTVKDNELQNKVTIYKSDNLSQIPLDERFDLIVSNPPHFHSNVYKLDIIGAYPRKYMDKDWELHKEFYRNVEKYLADDGVILLQEFAWASGLNTFRDMIESAGLQIKRHCMGDYTHPTLGQLVYYIEVTRKG